MTAQYFISLRGNKTGQSKAKRLNKTRAAETSFFGSLFESLVFLWVFFPLEKIKRATDLLSFTGGKCVLPAVFNPLSFCQCFLHNLECPLIPCLIAPKPVHLSNPGCSGASFPVKPSLALQDSVYILWKHFCVFCIHWSCSLCVCLSCQTARTMSYIPCIC